MKIVFDKLELAGDDAAGADNLHIDWHQIVQDADFLRAVEGTTYARGNRRRVITFTACHEFENIGDADAYMLALDDADTGRGTLILSDDAGGVNRFFKDAVIESAAAWQVGVSVFSSFKIHATTGEVK
jgi:hypothetical protein